jgi:simple sugar transport system ATP-binding protein
VTVLRVGRVVGTRQTAGATKHDLAQMMVGREVQLERDRPPAQLGEVRLRLDQVSAVNRAGTAILKNVSFEVHSGEIVGVAGVSGNGQRPLAEVIAGLQPVAQGQVILQGRDVTHFTPAKMIEAGLSYIPEERMHDGAVKDFSVAENLILQDHIRQPYSNGIFLNFRQIGAHAKEMIRSFNIKTPSQDTPAKNLSGGNIQKMILARELARQPKFLIAAQPTRGVDIGAMEYIHHQLLQQRSQGLATLLNTEDLDEVRALSDRIIVMFGGEVMGIVNNSETTVEELGLMMAGEKHVLPVG